MKRLPAALAVAVVVRLTFHALFLPAFEGPDEPHHLGRIAAFASGSPGAGFQGAEVPGEIVGAVRAFPCAPALSKAYGCPPFPSSGAAFDLLRPFPRPAPAPPVGNPEGNQPPLYYLAAALPLRAVGGSTDAAAMLLYARLLSVAFVALALFGPLRAAARDWSEGARVAGLLALLTPGASEALARASNDAAVFLWAACVLAALTARPKTSSVVLLLAAGPLLKLTAVPVVVFAVVTLVKDGRRDAAVAGAAGSLVVFPVQLLRGWLWGGTVELNRGTAAIGEPALAVLLGILRSAYAFAKTIFWVGGWSLLRPPSGLVAAWFALIAAAFVGSRLRRPPRRAPAHAAALVVALTGFLVFAVANRRLYGVWGGVAGWYFWDWSPWLAVAAADLRGVRPRTAAPLLAATGLFVLVSNAAWIAAHLRLYGG